MEEEASDMADSERSSYASEKGAAVGHAAAEEAEAVEEPVAEVPTQAVEKAVEKEVEAAIELEEVVAEAEEEEEKEEEKEEEVEEEEEEEEEEEAAQEDAEAAVARVSRLRVPELRSELRALGLADDGKRQDLLDRLVLHFHGAAETEEEGPEEEPEEENEEEAVPQRAPAGVPAGKLDPAAMFEAALNAEATAHFDPVGSFTEAELRAEAEDSAEEAEGLDSNSAETEPLGALGDVARAGADGAEKDEEPPLEAQTTEEQQPCGGSVVEEEPKAAEEASGAEEAPVGKFQRIMQWAKPFLGAPPAETASTRGLDSGAAGGEGEQLGDKGYAVCDELERKMEARSARKPTLGASETGIAREQVFIYIYICVCVYIYIKI